MALRSNRRSPNIDRATQSHLRQRRKYKFDFEGFDNREFYLVDTPSINTTSDLLNLINVGTGTTEVQIGVEGRGKIEVISASNRFQENFTPESVIFQSGESSRIQIITPRTSKQLSDFLPFFTETDPDTWVEAIGSTEKFIQGEILDGDEEDPTTKAVRFLAIAELQDFYHPDGSFSHSIATLADFATTGAKNPNGDYLVIRYIGATKPDNVSKIRLTFQGGFPIFNGIPNISVTTPDGVQPTTAFRIKEDTLDEWELLMAYPTSTSVALTT